MKFHEKFPWQYVSKAPPNFIKYGYQFIFIQLLHNKSLKCDMLLHQLFSGLDLSIINSCACFL